ncbi:MAG: zinc-binding dehydrogenase, partial [Leptothrix ochracea]
KASIHAGLILQRRLVITGSALRARSVAFKSAIAQALKQHIWPRIASGQIRPVIHAVLPASKAAEAHALMESGQHIGKIVLAW